MQARASKDTMQIEYGTNREYFAVRVANEDMKNANINRGAIVVIRKQRFAESGNIVLALHNGKVCFRYYKEQDGEIYLTAANNEILPVLVRKTDNFMILGKACEIRIKEL